jgi:CBS domain-containing protein
VVAVDALHRPEGVAVPERLLALVGERGLGGLAAVSVRAAFSPRVMSLVESDPLDVAARQLALRDVECAIVASVEGRFRGLITASELLGSSLASSS